MPPWPTQPRRRTKTRTLNACGHRPRLQIMYRKIIFILLICLSSLVVLAQDKPQTQKSDKDNYTLSVETLEVNLPISVLDKEGRPVNGLTMEQFQIFEDKVPQTIKTFRHEDIPLNMRC